MDCHGQESMRSADTARYLLLEPWLEDQKWNEVWLACCGCLLLFFVVVNFILDRILDFREFPIVQTIPVYSSPMFPKC